MIENKRIDILMATYNGEKYLVEQLDSIINQTYRNWNLLIRDDNSTDKTLEIIQNYHKKDKRIKIVNTEKNVGVVKGRNFLIELASGKYIAFLDADDYWHSQKLEKQIQFMKEKNAGISCTEYTRVKENGEKINEVVIKSEISYTDMLKNNYLGCLTVMYDVEKIGKRYFKELEKNEDYVLWLEIVKDVKTIYGLKQNLAYYRVLDNSRSSNKAKTAKVRWEIYRKIEKLPLLKSIYYFMHYAVRAVLKSK